MTVGIIGLGIMGSAYGRNLMKAGVEVIGVDPAPAARARLEEAGARAEEVPGDWLRDCELVILALISPTVLAEVTETLAELLKPGQIVLETGTFALADKNAAQARLEAAGVILLDCPVSGTGAQAAVADLVMMAAGPPEAVAQAKPLIAHFTKAVIDAGPFGAGMKLKFVANHAVALHNTVAAEVLNYADALGLDRDMVYGLLSNGAGQSKMLDLRMPLMISGAYDPPTASLKMFEKDLSLIGADIARLGLQAPLLDAVSHIYQVAMADLPEQYDAAAVFEVYRSGKAV
ncbi:NAD(P)-dependent oxidoreductase [Roseisalinus antarcticus]|uniref:2-hydroxy-3-oxopropionate reductase n=1 Tax=Roseisalinus antarcticus TaxID=254357 RepID=A0A1Y5U4K7_9RHOB|nr:NAD(P)-dependent oxidoreductase [Roseisalinus antarcticus]SLN76813.1 2-hydroxy-3-oxopropionate reductase [Roseisalinus antarcticus]